jgi:hypothetical protein
MISARVTQSINVDLSLSEAREVALKYICAKFDWKPSYSIQEVEENGESWVFHKTTVYSSHSFETEFRVRKATDRDKMVYEFLKEMQKT